MLNEHWAERPFSLFGLSDVVHLSSYYFQFKLAELNFVFSSEQFPWACCCLVALFSQKQHDGRQQSYATIVIIV